MKNRAKCNLCKEVIESFHLYDFVTCKCGEISIDGGQASFKCGAKDWSNFIRIDDQGKEIPVTIEDKNSPITENKDDQKLVYKPTKTELINMLEEMIKNIDGLPQHAMTSPINHYDFSSLLILLLALFKDDCISDN